MMSHAYHTRYALTTGGMISLRTHDPITAARARTIIQRHGLTVRRWVRLIDTWGWQVISLHDEANTRVADNEENDR